MLESAEADKDAGAAHLWRRACMRRIKEVLYMQIGQVIRKYRKDKNMTQEEMANRLGVTAPAVNKRENEVSFPDITLLAPIARLFGITVDELLSFHQELTNEEIRNIIKELDVMLKERTYEETFQWAKEKLELYPNCEQLFWQLALVLDVNRLGREMEDSGKYDEMINQWYCRALESKDEEIRTRAADSLFGFYERKEQYEKAEEYLAYFSDQYPEKKRKQALIYSKTGRRNEAYRAYEELLFSNYQMASLVFYNIYALTAEDGNMDKAHMLVEKQGELARVFDMGEYRENIYRLELASMEKNTDAAIETMEKLLASADGLCDYSRSPLYEHMEFKEVSRESLKQIKQTLMECFRDEETYGFMRGDRRWQELIRED